jgi:hypothetical protein
MFDSLNLKNRIHKVEISVQNPCFHLCYVNFPLLPLLPKEHKTANPAVLCFLKTYFW